MRTACLLMLCLLLSSCALTTKAPDGAATGPLVSLAWMAGRWTGTDDGIRMEEYWTVPDGAVMVGLHRDVPADGGVFFEYLRIEAREDGVFYVAQPRGGPAAEFRLVRKGLKKAVFENPAHDDPQRIVYLLGPDGRLQAEVHGKLDGTGETAVWGWERDNCK